MSPSSHGTPVSGLDLAPGSVLNAGRFGRLFRNVPVYQHDETTPRVGPPGQLAAIAEAMIEDAVRKTPRPCQTRSQPTQTRTRCCLRAIPTSGSSSTTTSHSTRSRAWAGRTTRMRCMISERRSSTSTISTAAVLTISPICIATGRTRSLIPRMVSTSAVSCSSWGSSWPSRPR